MKFLVIILFFLTNLIAQPDTLWTHTFGGSEDDWGNSIQQTSDGGFVIVGGTQSYGAGDGDVWLIKTDSDGNEFWTHTFGGSEDDWGSSIQQTSDGGFVIVGGTESYGAGDRDVWLIKTDSGGNELWNQTFGGSERDWGRSIQQTSDGGFVIVGGTESYGAGDWDVWLIKTDSGGIELWNQTFGGSLWDEGCSVSQTNNGEFVIVGHTYVDGDLNVWLIKTDSDGNELWNQTFGGSSWDFGLSIQQTSDDGFVLAGYTESFSADYMDMWLIKTDSEGNEIWNRTFGGSVNDRGYSVSQTFDGGFVIGGEKSTGVSKDMWLIKTDSEGNEIWNRTFGGSEDDMGRAVLQTNDGGFLITGSTQSYGAGLYDIWLIRLDNQLYGCTDPDAINYEPWVMEEDGSCIYISDIEPYFIPVPIIYPLNPMGIYINSAIIDGNGLRVGDEIGVFDGDMCLGTYQLEGGISEAIQVMVYQDNPDTPETDGYTTDHLISYRFWDVSNEYEIINVLPEILAGSLVFTPLGFTDVHLSVSIQLGCTDPVALNYDPNATVDYGSCEFEFQGCTNPEACNYIPEANIDDGSCLFSDCAGECGGSAFVDDCGCVGGSTGLEVNWCYGCTDNYALNFDPDAWLDDGSCEYSGLGDFNVDGSLDVLDIVALVQLILDEGDYIFYMDFNEDSFLNIIDIVILVDVILNPELIGCSDPMALNWNPLAVYEGNCEYPTITDIDGNSYETIQLGDQIWMVENLKVTHYNNGDPIPTDFSDSEWFNLDDNEIGAFAIYNDDPTNVEVYGNLYNWYSVNDDRGICPENWHVPSDEEWIELEMFLGMSYEEAHDTDYRGTDQGSQLAGNAGLWNSGALENNPAFGLSGFLANPSGYRDAGGTGYYGIGFYGIFWTSTVDYGEAAWVRVLMADYAGVRRSGENRNWGFSVRCIQDEN